MKDKQYIYFRGRKLDDVRVPFPVSRYVLQLSRPVVTEVRAHFFPLLSFLLMVSLGLASVGIVYGKVAATSAFFSDNERSSGNVFVADPIDFVLSASETRVVLRSDAPDPLTVLTIALASTSEPIQYAVTAQYVDGDRTLCDSLQVYTTAPFVHNGPLLSLVPATTTDMGSWTINMFPASANVTPDSQCLVRFVYTGESMGALPGQGYRVTKSLDITFVAPPAPPVQSLQLQGTPPEEVPPPIDQLPPPDTTSTPPPVDTPIQ